MPRDASVILTTRILHVSDTGPSDLSFFAWKWRPKHVLLAIKHENQAPAIVILLELKRVEAKLDQNDLFLVILHVIWMKNGYFGPFSHHFEWICCKITVISSNLRNFRDFKRNSMILMIVILPQKAWYFLKLCILS